MSINRVILTGRIGKDVDLRYTQSGKAVASFTLAVTNSFDRERPYWIPCTVWGKSAENCAQYLGKGSMAGIDGRISTRSYENQDGKKVYITEVVADRVEFLDSKKSAQSSPPPSQQQADDWSDIGSQIDVGDDIPF